METGDDKKGVHWSIKAFVLFHLLAVISWSLPPPPGRVLKPGAKFALRETSNYFLKANAPLKQSPIRDYLFFTGQWQSWDMFAPDPLNTDYWLDAVVTYQDGSVRRFQYPRMFDLSIGEKYFKERYRKYFENVRGDQFAYLWPDLAQRIALLASSDRGNLPAKVALVKHWKVVAPPGAPPNDRYLSGTFYEHLVDQKRLKAAAAG